MSPTTPQTATATATATESFADAVIGLGNPLLDIGAAVTEDFLAKYGLKPNDVILAEERHMPIYKELTDNHKVIFIAGGAAQNTLRGVQQLLPPGSTNFIGCVSDDKYGEILRAAAAKDGLRVHYQVDKSVPTGTCAALITNADRTLVTNLQAANKYTVDHLHQPQVWEYVKRARCVYIEGFFYTVSPPAIMALAEHCAAENKIFAMNLSAPFISQFFAEPLDASAPYWDVLVGNEAEAEAYAKSHNLDLHGNAAIAQHLANIPKANARRPRIVVLTHGPDATTVCVQGNPTPLVIPVPVVPKAEIVDTNGCGDAFVSGFLSELIRGADITRCVQVGHWLAAQVIRQDGAQYPAGLQRPALQ